MITAIKTRVTLQKSGKLLENIRNDKIEQIGVQGYVLHLQGESAAVLNALGALTECLERPGGCAVVPGLPEDQYKLTLITSVLGGFVAGYASRLEAQGKLLKPALYLP